MGLVTGVCLMQVGAWGSIFARQSWLCQLLPELQETCLLEGMHKEIRRGSADNTVSLASRQVSRPRANLLAMDKPSMPPLGHEP